MIEKKVTLSDIISLNQSVVNIIKNGGLSLSLKKSFERVGGFDYLFPITIYGRNHYLLSFWDIFNPNKGGNFYKCDILGLNPKFNIGFSHTLWGVFYMHLNIVGVIFGMFLWGKINRFLFEILKKLIYIKIFLL